MEDAWNQSIRQLLRSASSIWVGSATGGDSLELENMIITVAKPRTDAPLPKRFLFPELVQQYATVADKGLNSLIDDVQTIFDRVNLWPARHRSPIPQLDYVVAELKANSASRRGVVALWDPEIDLTRPREAPPLCHCGFYFSVRNARLNMSVTSRSIDAWMGAVPNMVAFFKIQQQVARRLRIPVGDYTHHAFSYHIYQNHLPKARASFSDDFED